MTASANYLEKILYLVLIKERELNIKRCLLSFDFLERNTNKNRKTLFSEVVKLIEDLLFRLNQLNDTNLNTPPIIFSSGNYKFFVNKNDIEKIKNVYKIFNLCYGSEYLL